MVAKSVALVVSIVKRRFALAGMLVDKAKGLLAQGRPYEALGLAVCLEVRYGRVKRWLMPN